MRNAAESDWVIDVTDEQFEADVLERSNEVPVVIDFWAEWCRYCHVLAPLLVAQAKQQQGKFVLAKVNVDENPQWAGQMQINGLPAVRVLYQQQLVDGFDGALPEEQVREFVERILPSPADQAVQQAQALEATDPAAAEALYRGALEQKPDRDAALIGLARVLVQQQRGDEARPLLDRIGVGTEFGADAERLRRVLEMREARTESGEGEAQLRARVAAEPGNAAHHHALGGYLATQERYPEALEALLDAAKLDRKLAGNEVRELMVKIFQIVGVRSELSEKYRDELKSILY